MENTQKKLHYGFVIVIAVFIQMLFCGGIFYGASGVFIVPVTTALGIGQGDFSMYLTIQSVTLALTMFAAPKLLQKCSYKNLNSISVVVASIGFAIMGFARNVVLLYVGGDADDLGAFLGEGLGQASADA